LDVEQAVHIRARVDHPVGELGGDVDPVAVGACQDAAEEGLAGPRMVGPGGVDVVHTGIDEAVYLRAGSLFINAAALAGQAHRPGAED